MSLEPAAAPSHWRAWLICSLVQAVVTAAVGLLAIDAAGGPISAMAVQACALVLGAGAAWAASRLTAHNRRAVAWALGLSLAAAAATLVLGESSLGVRRWLSAGPILLHPMSVALPFVVWACAGEAVGWRSATALAVLVLLIGLQPDAGALLALSGGLLGLTLVRPFNRWIAVAAVIAVAAAAWAWLQPDPLPAVAHVERVVSEAWAVNSAIGGAAAVLLIALPLPFFAAGLAGASWRLGLGLGGLWLGHVLANLFGNYPAPMIGYGASFVLGWLASLGLAASGLGRRADSAQTVPSRSDGR